MMILNLRQKKTAVLAILVVLVLFSVYAFDLKEETRIERKTLLRGEWGKGEGQFGLGQGQDGKKYGPQSFGLDQNGNIYILDTYNNRVALYDFQGRPVFTFQVAEAGKKVFLADLAVDGHNNIWIVDNANYQVLRFSPAGTALEPFTPEPVEGGNKGDLKIIESISVDWAGNLYLEDSYTGVEKLTRRIRRFGPSGQMDLDLATVVASRREGVAAAQTLPAELNSLAVGKAGWLYLETGREPFLRQIVVLRDGLPEKELTIRQDDFIKTSALLGTDRGGRIFLGLNLGTPAGRVLVLNAEGRLQHQIAAPGFPEIQGRVWGRVDPEGNLYLLAFSREGLTMEKIRLEKGRRLTFLGHPAR